MKKEHAYIGIGISLLILLGYFLKDMKFYEDYVAAKKARGNIRHE